MINFGLIDSARVFMLGCIYDYEKYKNDLKNRELAQRYSNLFSGAFYTLFLSNYDQSNKYQLDIRYKDNENYIKLRKCVTENAFNEYLDDNLYMCAKALFVDIIGDLFNESCDEDVKRWENIKSIKSNDLDDSSVNDELRLKLLEVLESVNIPVYQQTPNHIAFMNGRYNGIVEAIKIMYKCDLPYSIKEGLTAGIEYSSLREKIIDDVNNFSFVRKGNDDKNT